MALRDVDLMVDGGLGSPSASGGEADRIDAVAADAEGQAEPDAETGGEADATTGASPGTAQACKDLGLNSLADNIARLGIKPPGQA